MVNRQLAERAEQSEQEQNFSAAWEDQLAEDWKWAANIPHPTSPGVEEELFIAAERLRVEHLIETIPEREWGNWLQDYLEGLSIRRSARRRGVSHTAIRRRREAGMERLREHFEGEQ